MYCNNCGAAIPSDAAYCPNCGTPLSAQNALRSVTSSPNTTAAHAHPPLSQAMIAPKPKKSKVWLIVSLALGVFLIIGAAFLFSSNNNPRFEMESDCSLYYDGNASGQSIEIPTEFDGKANSFSNIKDSSAYRFIYNGKLKQFVKYHSWIFFESYPSHQSEKTIICDDYVLKFAINGKNYGTVSKHPSSGGIEYIKVYYTIYDSDGNTIEDFENLSALRDWLE